MQSTVNDSELSDAPDNSLPCQPQGAESQADLRDRRVVIVEDDALSQLHIKRILRSQDMEVVGMASDGQEAIRMVLDLRPDVVVMDIKMPCLNGLEASERILQQYPVCIVILSAFSDVEYYQKADTIGTSGYIVKPISAETLVPQLLFAYRKFLRTKG